MSAALGSPQVTVLHRVAKRVLRERAVEEKLLEMTPLDEPAGYDPAVLEFHRNAQPEPELDLDSECWYPAAMRSVRAPKPAAQTAERAPRKKAGSYSELAGELAASGLPDAEIASGVRAILAGQQPRIAEEKRPVVEDLAELLFVTEPARNETTVVTAPLMLDLISNYGMTFQEFLNDQKHDYLGLGGGLFPASFGGAEGASKSGEGDEPPPDRRKQREEMLLREKKLLDLWKRKRNIQGSGEEEMTRFVTDTYGVKA